MVHSTRCSLTLTSQTSPEREIFICRSRKNDLAGHGIPGLNVRNWAEQAQAVTDVPQQVSRSAATAAEIRLREALHKCSLAAGEYPVHTNRPYRLRTAVCCKLLEEFATLAGPFSGILQTLFEELVCTTSSALSEPMWWNRLVQISSCVVVSLPRLVHCCRSIPYTATPLPIKAARVWISCLTMWWFRNLKCRILHCWQSSESFASS